MCYSVDPGFVGRFIGLFLVISTLSANAQNMIPVQKEQVVDTIQMKEVEIGAYFTKQPLLKSTASAAIVGEGLLRAQQGITLVSAMNTVPGVRMEERSPGSYRLSIRGSLLRSPFGIRNIKVYLEEMPLTDAGGNTYLNLLDAGAIGSAEILKGPDGSIFGANSGGVVILRSEADTGPLANFRLQGGSFGLIHQASTFSKSLNPGYHMSLLQSYQKSNGYREHSALDKLFLQTRHQWQYRQGKTNILSLNALYGDLNYQTPGGLTAAQYDQDPAAARQATPTVPGPVEQHAGIHNRTLHGGLTHKWNPFAKLEHSATAFGSYTDFQNPFITNYEKRFEHNGGFRTFVSYRSDLGQDQYISKSIVQIQVGIEWQSGDYRIENFDNIQGNPGSPQALDQIKVQNGTSFVRMALNYENRWMLEGSLSHNFQKYQLRELYPTVENTYNPHAIPSQWMPRLAFSYQPSSSFAVRALVSRGFSPPTTAEIRPSDNIINTDLNAEVGWNNEVGLRFQNADRRFFLDLSLFKYKMDQAIVRGSRENGAEFFRNAGKIDQKGLELLSQFWLIGPSVNSSSFGWFWTGSWAFSHFRFLDYQSNAQDFSGNALTGVPAHTMHQSFRFLFQQAWEGFLNYHYSSSIPLNDENSISADPYHLVQVKVSWKTPLKITKRTLLEVYAGGDNLLDQKYSLGNDINAFGARYFNAAPTRNFYAGFSLQF